MTSTDMSGQTARSPRGRAAGREPLGRDRVMQVALQQFLTRGYAGTSLKVVAQELGVSPPALYWYFSSKEDLYVSVIEQAMEQFVTYVRESITDEDPLFRLSQLVRAHVTWQLQQSDVAQAFELTMNLRGLTTDISKDRLAPIFKMELDYVEQVRQILREGTDNGTFSIDDYKTTAFAIITLCEYVTTWYRAEGELSVAAVANKYDGMVRRLVGASTSKRPDRESPPE